jgi:hypothetical protein
MGGAWRPCGFRGSRGEKEEHVKHPVGVVINAIFLAVISLFVLLMALGMALAATLISKAGTIPATPGAPAMPAIPPWMAGFELGTSGFFILLAAWAIATVAGLFGLRRWARYSVLVIGGAMAAIGSISLLTTAVTMALMPMPQPASVDPSQAHLAQSMMKTVFAFILVFYGLVAALGIYWLVYFNLKRVREAFAGPAGVLVESRRPGLISVIAVLCFIGAPACLVMALLPFPATMLGFTLHGVAKGALYAVFAGLQAAVGIGLWRMEEWGRRLELGFLALGVVNCLVYVVRPGLMVQATREMYKSMSVPPQPLTPQMQSILYRGTLLVSILMMVAFMIPLIYYRRKFGPQDEAQGPVLVQ